jgi:hypothetical protein
MKGNDGVGKPAILRSKDSSDAKFDDSHSIFQYFNYSPKELFLCTFLICSFLRPCPASIKY